MVVGWFLAGWGGPYLSIGVCGLRLDGGTSSLYQTTNPPTHPSPACRWTKSCWRWPRPPPTSRAASSSNSQRRTTRRRMGVRQRVGRARRGASTWRARTRRRRSRRGCGSRWVGVGCVVRWGKGWATMTDVRVHSFMLLCVVVCVFVHGFTGVAEAQAGGGGRGGGEGQRWWW